MPANDDLTHRYVLIHPGLQHDAAAKQNWPGMILSADITADDYIVSFQDNTRGRYAADALLVLKPRAEIHQLLADHGEHMAFPDLKTLTQLDLFLRYGTGDVEWKALQLAAENANIHELTLNRLKDILSVQPSQSYKR